MTIEHYIGLDNNVVGFSVWKQLCTPRVHDGQSLTVYGGYLITVLRATSAFVNFKSVLQELDLIVVATVAPALHGRLWIAAFTELCTWLHISTGINSITSMDYTQ